MGSPELENVSDEDARRLARSLVAIFRSPLKILGMTGLESPPTIADAIRLGGILIGALNVATCDPVLKEKAGHFATKVAEFIYMPEEMEEFLYTRIKEKTENPDEIRDAITQVEALMPGPGAARRFLVKSFTEVLPKGRQGRPTEFDPSCDPDRFLALSSTLNKACDQFLSLRERFPKKSLKETFAFLHGEEPRGIALMRKHDKFISEVLNDYDFQVLKTHETRTRRLADALAGKELLGWSFKYSVQRGGEFRRTRGVESG